MKLALDMTMKDLTSKQRQAVPLLASGMTGKNVAKAIKVNPATISQWINHNEQFGEALDNFSKGSCRLAQVQLESLTICAIVELKGLLLNAKSEQVRLRAIELIMTSAGLYRGMDKGKQISLIAMDKQIEFSTGQYNFTKLIDAIRGA